MRPTRYDLGWRSEHLPVLAVLLIVACAALFWRQMDRPVRLGRTLPIDPDRAQLASLRLDPNVESAASLRRLPGLGVTRAAAIVEHRTAASGPFTQPADLQSISGIGPITVERIEPYLQLPAD